MSDVDDILGIESAGRETKASAMPIPIAAMAHRRAPVRRRLVDNLRVQSAIAALDGLPGPGETWHCLMDGSYDSFDLVQAILHHASPATVKELNLATLGFNFANLQMLMRMLERGEVQRATMVVSCWYQSDPKEVDVCTTLAQELARRGGWYVAARSHAKVQLLEMTDGTCYVIESSANLRTCRSIEQFCLTQDRDLLLFHRRWLESVYERSHSDREGYPSAGVGAVQFGPQAGVQGEAGRC